MIKTNRLIIRSLLVCAILFAFQFTANAQPADNTRLKDVLEAAKKNNDTTPVTTGEITAAAKQAEKEKKFMLAVDYYGELIKLNPDNYEWYVQRGVLLLNELKKPKDAANDFTKAIQLKPDEPMLLFNRGTAYLHATDWKKSKADFDKLISLQPENINAYLNRGIVFLNMKKNDEALADFNKGIQLNPRYSNLYRARALAYKAKGETNLAQADELKAAQFEQR